MSSQNFEQMVSLYHGIFVYCGIAAIVCVVAAIVLFILLKIPQVFSELSGRGAKKAIAEMTEGDHSGSLGASRKIGHDGKRKKGGKTSGLGTGKLRKNAHMFTEELGETGRMNGNRITHPVIAGADAGYTPADAYNAADYAAEGSAETNVLDTYGSDETNVLDNYGSEDTNVLDSYGSSETNVLNSYGDTATDVLGNYGNTMPLSGQTDMAAYGETMVLGAQSNPVNETAPTGFVVLRSIVEIHTDEVI